MTIERLEARWINDQYVAQPETTADEWYSTDGDEWVNQDGEPVDSPEFDATIFVLVGGPRDGKQVNQAQTYSKRFFQQLGGLFKGKNISVLDPTGQSFRNGLPATYRTENLRRDDQILLGQYLKADVVLSGRVDVVRLRSDSSEHKIDYALELWQTKTGRSLWEMSKTENVASDNPKAILAAMEQAQPEIFKDLSAKVNDAVAAGSVSKARKAANHVNHADGMVAAFGSEEYRQQAIVSVEQAA
jgi:hypothetical protein